MLQLLSRRYAAPAAAAFGSLFISLLAWHSRGAINNDGVLYLQAAQAFLERGLYAALEVYSWPFYSVLIALVSLAGMSLPTAAYVLNAITFSLLAFGFVAVLRLLTPGRAQVPWIGVAVILLLPELNELRSAVVRDTGFLAFFLLSLWALLSFLRDGGWHKLMVWSVAVALATLFRIEGFILALAGPFALLLCPPRRVVGAWLLAACVLCAVVGTVALARFAPESRITEFQHWLTWMLDIGNTLRAASDRLAEAVLGPYARSYAQDALAAALLVVFVGNVIKGLTVVHLGLLAWGLRRPGLQLDAVSRRTLWVYGIGVALPPLVFVVAHQFLTQRYVFGVILVLLLLATLAIARLLAALSGPRARMAMALVLLLAFGAASARKLINDDTLSVAGRWLAAQQGAVWTDSKILGYYAEDGGTREVVVDEGASPEGLADGAYTWVAIVARHPDPALVAVLESRGAAEHRRFAGRSRDVVIWRLP